MKEITLTRGMKTFVDDDFVDELARHKWFAVPSRKTFYAARTEWSGPAHRQIRMHNFIANPPNGFEIHHINGNGLDNRLENLRVVTRTEHLALHPRRAMRNERQGQKVWGFSSQYVGVCQRKQTGHFDARITAGGKQVFLGTFDTERQAALAYNEAATYYYGHHARLNSIV